MCNQGAIIAKAFERVGANGHVVIEESPTMTDDVDFTEVRQILSDMIFTLAGIARPEWMVKRREN